uniref:NADH-ubiquinone oxidoreductase chain 6 n=1 Tax=Erotylidae sp. BMNH 1274392 TaxID=1796504 RepID=A0A140EFV6_9CUCU|nr:NADH dehydrogenase subunit 6 [Erotylidae sp. BMNH 1274392]
MLTLMLTNLTMFSLMFIFMNHPLTKGSILLIQTLLICLTTGLTSTNYWYSYILFLIMVGGMMVLFIYMTSIASNEKFKFSLNLFMLMNMMLLINLFLIILDNFFLSNNLINNESLMINSSMNFNLSLNKYMNYPTNMIMFTIIIYLFITLIASVKITKIEYGPLRQKF